MASRLGVGTKEMFILSRDQLATLRALDIGEPATLLVRSLNGLTKPRGSMYQEREAIETIQSVPRTPADMEQGQDDDTAAGQPDWEKWWLDHLNEAPGVHRPQEECGEECAVLKETIRAMGKRAVRSMPGVPGHSRAHEGTIEDAPRALRDLPGVQGKFWTRPGGCWSPRRRWRTRGPGDGPPRETCQRTWQPT